MWQKTIVQASVEIDSGEVSTKQEADEWWTWKRQAHLDAGWSILTEVPDSVTVQRQGHANKTDKIRTFTIAIQV